MQAAASATGSLMDSVNEDYLEDKPVVKEEVKEAALLGDDSDYEPKEDDDKDDEAPAPDELVDVDEEIDEDRAEMLSQIIVLKCPHCDFVSRLETEMKKHLKGHADRILILQCPECHYFTPNEPQMKRHVVREHPEVELPPAPSLPAAGRACKTCAFRTPSAKLLREHERLAHGRRAERYKEELRERREEKEAAKAAAAKARSAVAATELLRCEQCDFATYAPRALKQHVGHRHERERVLAAYPKNNVCEHCGKGFYNRYQLGRHVAAVHVKARVHPCPHCDKSFCTKENAVAHAKHMHAEETGRKKFFCEHCGKNFKTCKQLKLHANRVHDPVKSAHCDKCDFKASTEDYLIGHQARVHKIYPEGVGVFCHLCPPTSSYWARVSRVHIKQPFNDF